MNLYDTRAIVLKREDRGEADRLYTLFTYDWGKVKAQAQGVRKINAKLTGHLEPFQLIWVEVVMKRSGQIGVTKALSSEFFLRTAFPWQIRLAFQYADLLDKLLVEPDRDEAIWNFLLLTFRNLASIPQDRSEEAFLDFKKNLFNLLGYGYNFDDSRPWLGDFDV